jgi:hypothetical protein
MISYANTTLYATSELAGQKAGSAHPKMLEKTSKKAIHRNFRNKCFGA